MIKQSEAVAEVEEVRRYLQDGHLVPQLALLLGGEPHLIDDLDGHVSARLPVFA